MADQAQHQYTRHRHAPPLHIAAKNFGTRIPLMLAQAEIVLKSMTGEWVTCHRST
jgi:hypothetical protein